MSTVLTAKRPPEGHEETIHGMQIRDSYRDLEDANSPETKEFVREQMAYTQDLLGSRPSRDAIRARLEQLFSIGSITAPQIGTRTSGNRYFYTRREGRQNQAVLYVRDRLEGEDRPLVDVNKLNPQGTTALDWFYASHNGTYVCFGTSENGSEISDLQVIETAGGRLLPLKITRARAASVAWKHDNSGFYYTRYPRSGEVEAGDEVYYRKVFYHALGSAGDGSDDKLVFSYDKDPQAWPNVSISDDDRWLLIAVSQGWTRVNLFLKGLAGEPEPVEITEGKDFLYRGEIYKGSIYLVSNEDAPRFRVFKIDVGQPLRHDWREIIPQTPGQRDAVLHSAAVIGGQLVATYEQDVTAQAKIFTLQGRFLRDIEMPGLGSITGISGNYDTQEGFFDFQSFTIPPTVYRIDLAANASVTAWQALKAPIDACAYEVRQVFYESKDGTSVPMFIICRKGTALDGNQPTWLTGYGGFNVSNSPVFRASAHLWLERSGIFAVANIRGGAEYGEDWHRAGMLDRKQNVFDDFIAAAEYLIRERYTNPNRLAIQGGSNGGLLVGAVMTQRPELFRAVICQVPLLDMLRYQGFQIAKLWIPEYGTAQDPQQFEWLYAYSPYHHVQSGRGYPAVLFMTADTDTRVDPMHAKKMAALMQAEAANGRSKDRPILLRIESQAGHGAGKPRSKQLEEFTDLYSFLFWQLGMEN